MTIDVRDQLRDYFEYVDDVLSATDRPPLASQTDHEQEIVMLTPNDAERTRRSHTWWLAAAVIAALAIGGVVLMTTRSDPEPDAPATDPEPEASTSAARAVGDDLVAAVNDADRESLRELTEAAMAGSEIFGTSEVDRIVDLLDWLEVVDGKLEVTTCVGEGDVFVECVVEVDARLEDAEGYVIPSALMRVRVDESGGVQTVELRFGTEYPAAPPEKALREFRVFVDERHPGDSDVMWTSPGDGGYVRPSSTPESLALWEAHVEEFVNDWTSSP